VAPFGNATLAFDGLFITKTLNINARNVVAIPFPGPDKVSVVINPGTGLFAGKFIHPTDGLRRTFSGAVIQNQVRGEGLFHGIDMGNNVTGKVELAPLE
jgi:hypothetical protein